MSKLAILGGKPVFDRLPEYAAWPRGGEMEKEALLRVLRSGVWGTLGEENKNFSEKYAEYCHAKYALPVLNGTVSLELIFRALGIGYGDEIIVPPYTFSASVHSIALAGAMPVFADIDPETFTLSPESVRSKITPRTRAILGVHLGGRPFDVDALRAIAEEHDIYLIEDAAHAHGSEWKGRRAGSLGKAGSFSFQASKILTTGEGGMCITSDKDLYDRMYSLKNCGRETYPGSPAMQSGNFRSNDFAAALGLAQLTRLDAQNALRHENALYLEKELSQIPGLASLRRDDRITNQTYFHFYMKLDLGQWRNVPRKYLTRAVKAELENSLEIRYPYDPLNASSLYHPFTKKTHMLGEAYQAAIDPARFDLPVCTHVSKGGSFGFFHNHLLSDKQELDKIIAAFHKIHDNLDELEQAAKNG